MQPGFVRAGAAPEADAGADSRACRTVGTAARGRVSTCDHSGAELLRKDSRTVADGMGGEVGTMALADSIDNVRREAEESVNRLVREKRELDAARIARNQAQDVLVETYQNVTGLLMYVFRLAGHPELAERIRPALRRSPRAGDDDAGSDDGEPAETQPGTLVAVPVK
jgi:hypothetical protein